MNLRREQLANELLDGMSLMDIPSGTLLIVSIPDDLDAQTTRMIGVAINSAMKAIGKDNPIILMPKEIGLSAVNEEDMKELGYVRATPDNAVDSRLREPLSCDSITGDIIQERDIWPDKIADLAGHWRDRTGLGLREIEQRKHDQITRQIEREKIEELTKYIMSHPASGIYPKFF